MQEYLNKVLAMLLVVGLIGLALYFFGFGQTFEGPVEINAGDSETAEHEVGWVTIHPRFRTRRFARYTLSLDLPPNTPMTFRSDPISPIEAVEALDGLEVEGRVRYRRGDDPHVLELDLEPMSTSLKEYVLFGSLVSLAVIAKRGD